MKTTHLITGLVAVAVVFLLALSTFFTIEPSDQALVLQFGDPVRVVTTPGLHEKIPFVQNVVRLDRRVLNFDAPAVELPTLDQKQVVISAYVQYRITDPLTFYRVGQNEANAESQIRGVLGASLRRVIGNVQMGQILTAERDNLMRDITAQLKASVAAPYGIELLDVRLKRVDLPTTNSEAIFSRMSTQRGQEAKRFRAEGEAEARTRRAEADKQRVVILAEARKQAEILRGEGDALAAQVYNDAYGQDTDFFDFYRSLQAMRESLPGDKTIIVGPSSGDFFHYFRSTDRP
ncbi:MAG TPA: protease modulator HflC [Dongiaceae bacterium]|jgi:membrane protease subunit HflC|nr:protease modulator HflC [Dongiaceae bacterium]